LDATQRDRTPAGSAELYHRPPCASAGRTEVAVAKNPASRPPVRSRVSVIPPQCARPWIPARRGWERERERERARAEPGPQSRGRWTRTRAPSLPSAGYPAPTAPPPSTTRLPVRNLFNSAVLFPPSGTFATGTNDGSDCACCAGAAEAETGSSAWIGKGLSCVCAQRRDSDARLSFDLTPTQVGLRLYLLDLISRSALRC
jgi:hypothetical protein